MDQFKRLAQVGMACTFWRCWENRSRPNAERRIARKSARRRLKQALQRESVGEVS